MNAPTLFPLHQDFRVVRLTEDDARRSTHILQMFDEQIVCNEHMYPDIKHWFRNRVIPGLKVGSRVAYLGFQGETPVITAVVKRGEHAKFCHLRIEEEFQDHHLGEVFFSMMALEVRTMAKDIHFTLPEGLWHERRGFFSGFGFKEVTRARTQYRLFEEELHTSAPFWNVWRKVRERLPKLARRFSISNYSMAPNLVLSIRPAFVNRVLNGTKTVEVRRKFHARWRGARVALYSSSPDRALVGEATVDEVHSAAPSEIWTRFGTQINCSIEEFWSYAADSKAIVALKLGDVVPYVARLPVCQFEYLLEEELLPPQSHCEVGVDQPWSKAISIAALLHGCQRVIDVPRSAAAP